MALDAAAIRRAKKALPKVKDRKVTDLVARMVIDSERRKPPP